jgi:hypothetical protein
VTTAPAPVTAAPAPVAAAAPAPMAATPAPMSPSPPAPMSSPSVPAHLFGLQMFHLIASGDSGTGILVRRRQRSVLCERLRHKRCCLCTCGQRGSARRKSKGEFQKMAAFHDIFLSTACRGARHGSINRQIWDCSSPKVMFARIGVMRALNPPRRTRIRPVAEGQALGTSQAGAGSMMTGASEYLGFRLLWSAKLADKPRPSRWQLHRVNPIAFPASKRARPFTVNWHHKHHKGTAVLTSLR